MQWFKTEYVLPKTDNLQVAFTLRDNIVVHMGRFYLDVPYPFENDNDAYSVEQVVEWIPFPPYMHQSVSDTISKLLDLLDAAANEHGDLAQVYLPEYQTAYENACQLLGREPHEMLV